jgi:acid phosphatase (class A)
LSLLWCAKSFQKTTQRIIEMPISIRNYLYLGLVVCVANAVHAQEKEATIPEISDPHFQFSPGYISPKDLPDSLQLLGKPPAAGSRQLARDEEVRESTIPLRGTARWKLASQDADLTFPVPAQNFSCAMGVPIDEQTVPHVYTLMRRVLTDAGLSTYGVKNQYRRIRPFVVHNEGTCRPDQEAMLRNDGSYPSGHTAAGWAWALVLAEINPARSNALLSRGLSFGQSRVICNAHWQSDVDAGRIMGAAAVAKLHTDPAFLSDLRMAREEVIKAVAAGKGAQLQCAVEAEALAIKE